VAPKTLVAAAVAAAALCVPSIASADVVVDWNRTLVDALYLAHTPPQTATRAGAIVQTAVFDSVNGVTRRYAQFRPDVVGAAPRGASAPAAAASAAYTALVALFPTQKPTFDTQFAASLAQIVHARDENGGARAITRGMAWGKAVANAIIAWRDGDGLNAVLPDYALPAGAGVWQPQPGLVNPVFRQYATMAPWTMSSPGQFRPGPPPALDSAGYLADLAQVRSLGNALEVTPEHAETARFWQGKFDTVVTMWNRTAASLVARGHGSLTQNARSLALLNVALADASIAVWDAKNAYNFWRPITAIRAVPADKDWQPTLPTPNHQEYPSGHSGLSAAAATVLGSVFGRRTSFTVVSDGVAAPGDTRAFSGFDALLAEIALARVYGGIHFLGSCTTAQALGRQLAEQALATQMTPRRGDDD
jgi:hypothetical protein